MTNHVLPNQLHVYLPYFFSFSITINPWTSIYELILALRHISQISLHHQVVMSRTVAERHLLAAFDITASSSEEIIFSTNALVTHSLAVGSASIPLFSPRTSFRVFELGCWFQLIEICSGWKGIIWNIFEENTTYFWNFSRILISLEVLELTLIF